VKAFGLVERIAARPGVGYAAALAIGRGMSFLLVLLLARFAGQTDLGHIALFLAALEFIDQFLFESLRVAFLRLHPEANQRAETAKLSWLALFHLAAGVAAVAPLVVALAFWMAPEAAWLTAAMLWLAIAATGFFRFSLAEARANENVGRFLRLEAFRSVLIVTLVTAAVWRIPAHFEAAAAALAAAALTAAIVSAPPVLRGLRGGRVPIAAVVKEGRELRQLALPFAASIFASAALPLVERGAIAHALGPAAVGIYFAVQGVVRQPLGLVGTATAFSAFVPLMRSVDLEGENAAAARLARLCALLLFGLVPAALGMILVAPEMVGVLLGQQFVAGGGAGLVALLAAAAVIANLRDHWLGAAFHMRRKLSRLAGVSFFALAVAAPLLVLGAEYRGLEGVAWATLAWSVLSFSCFALAARGLAKFSVEPRYVAILAGAVAALIVAVGGVRAALAGVAPPLLLAGSVVVGVLAFCATAYACNVFGLRSKAAGGPQ
jgi:O-antigen/teichoic acid export membrane protein